MISAQTLRVCREGKPVSTFPDHALKISGAIATPDAASLPVLGHDLVAGTADPVTILLQAGQHDLAAEAADVPRAGIMPHLLLRRSSRGHHKEGHNQKNSHHLRRPSYPLVIGSTQSTLTRACRRCNAHGCGLVERARGRGVPRLAGWPSASRSLGRGDLA
jgi:hypothetical protein